MNHFYRLCIVMLCVVVLVSSALASAKRDPRGVGKLPKAMVAKLKHKEPIRDFLENEVKPFTKEAAQASVTEAPYTGPNYRLSPNATPLSGVKRIGLGKDFPNLATAFTSLDTNGVSGPLTLLLSDASYTDAGIFLTGPPGASATNTVTIQPDSNVLSVVIDLYDYAGAGGGMIFKGARYVTVNGTRKNGTPDSRDLTIRYAASQPQPPAGNAALRLRDGCGHVTIMNCYVYGRVGSTSATRAIRMTGKPNSDILVSNCLMGNGNQGFDSDDGNFVDYDVNVRIVHNQVGETYGAHCVEDGIRLGHSINSEIAYNIVDGIRYPSTFPAASVRPSGIRTRFVFATSIHHNIVNNVLFDRTTNTTNQGRAYGIRHAGDGRGDGTSTENIIYNNCITNIFSRNTSFSSPGINNSYGIESVAGQQDKIYNNSIYLTGSALGPGLAVGIVPFGSGQGSLAIIENNAVRIDRTGTDGNFALAPFGLSTGSYDDIQLSEHNVLNSTDFATTFGTLYDWYVASGKDLASTDNNPFFLSEADLHIDTTQPSAVASFGASLPEVTDDIDGQARSVPNPEAGYDEFTGPVPGLHEVQPVDIINPPLSGLPQGLPFVGVSAKFKNNTTSSESYTARMRILDSSGTEVYNSTAAVTGHTGLTFMTVTWTDPFTPSIGALYTFIATSELGTDARPENDTVMSQRPAVPLIAGPVYKTTYETAAEQFGWFGTQDFEFGTPAKVILNAAHSGVNAWVTKLSGNYSEGGVDNQIYSPFFDFSSTTKGYVSWYHSMVTEPSWDGSIFEYSIDSGKTYKRLAPFVNDPDGVNWYSTSTYANAAGDTNCFDFGRSIIVGFLPPGVFGPKWTSNGVCSGADVATGPYGYVYIEHKLPPEVFGKTYVRFRYSFFSDGFGADEGVAFDDFSIDTVGAASNASISGMAWIDNNGNGIKDAGELPDVGRVILLSGSGTGRMVTDPGGLYSFTSLAPGVYTVEESTKTGWAVTTPPEKVYNISLSPGQTVSDADFGGFQGTIGGTVYNDITVNGAKDSGDPPLSNWRVRLLVGSTEVDNQLTNTSGDYQFSVGPGTYTIQEDVQDGWKQSAPPGFEYTDLHIDTVTGSSSIAGKDFGNYKLGRVQGVVFNDVNGNGIQNAPTDLGSIGFVVKLFKGSVLVDTALTSSTSFFTNFDIEKIDTGRYTLSQVPRSGYVQTAPSGGGSFSLTFDSSGQFFTKRLFGNFRLGSISGKVAIDINRNGILDPQDTIPLVSWRIRLVKDSVQVDSVLTSSSGGYAFSNLGPATYKVSIVTQSGWTQTLPAAQAPYTVTMSSGASVTNQNFGITLVTTAVGTGEELPKEFALHQNYPNPFNPVTMIKFDLPKTSTVGLSVYNVLGQQVAVLVANDRFMPGRYVEPFNGGNFPSGLYFYRIEAVAEDGEVFTQVLKMMLLK